MVLDLVKYIKNIKKCHKNMGNGAGGLRPPAPPRSTGSPPSATDLGQKVSDVVIFGVIYLRSSGTSVFVVVVP